MFPNMGYGFGPSGGINFGQNPIGSMGPSAGYYPWFKYEGERAANSASQGASVTGAAIGSALGAGLLTAAAKLTDGASPRPLAVALFAAAGAWLVGSISGNMAEKFARADASQGFTDRYFNTMA
ncbi:MAG: hypothetical protein VKJ06_01120 [Vampirovibrionales bacterium]|nr:hypothetical protein [Vampirovibrionales bacterium]